MFLSEIYKFVMCKLSYYIMVYWCIKSIVIISELRDFTTSHINSFKSLTNICLFHTLSFERGREGFTLFDFSTLLSYQVYEISENIIHFFYTKYVIILLYHNSFPVYYILLKDSFNNIKKARKCLYRAEKCV